MKVSKNLSLLLVLLLSSCFTENEKTEETNVPTGETVPPPPSPKSIGNHYAIKRIDFKDNHKLRTENEASLKKIVEVIDSEFINSRRDPKDEKYKNAADLLQPTSVELENIFKRNLNIKKAFEDYKINGYMPINEMLQQNKYIAPLVGPAATCAADPTKAAGAQRNKDIIRCMDIAYQQKPAKSPSNNKTVIFRTLRSDSGDSFNGLNYGCFNAGQQNYIEGKGFGSATTSLSAALTHHNNIAAGVRDLVKKYDYEQKAIIFMIEVDENDPVFKFPKSLDNPLMLTVEEKEVLLKRGFRLQFICEPTEFLPDLPNEFEYIPTFNANATTSKDYKAYRFIRAKLVYANP